MGGKSRDSKKIKIKLKDTAWIKGGKLILWLSSFKKCVEIQDKAYQKAFPRENQ